MKCRDVRRNLYEISDGRMPPHMQELAGRHLRECRRCASLIEREREMARLLGDLAERRLERCLTAPQAAAAGRGGKRGLALLRQPAVFVSLAFAACLFLLVFHPAFAPRPPGAAGGGGEPGDLPSEVITVTDEQGVAQEVIFSRNVDGMRINIHASIDWDENENE